MVLVGVIFVVSVMGGLGTGALASVALDLGGGPRRRLLLSLAVLVFVAMVVAVLTLMWLLLVNS